MMPQEKRCVSKWCARETGNDHGRHGGGK